MHSNKQPRVESFSRLVSLGGGKVVKAEPPYSDPKDANHCLYEKVSNVFVDFKARKEYEVQPLRTSINPVSLQALAANGVAVVGPVFINDYLVSDTKPKVEDCLVEDFKTYWHTRR